MRHGRASTPILTLVAWTVAIIVFFPILWMLRTSLETETDVIAEHALMRFAPTLESYTEVLARTGYLDFAYNSLIVSLVSTVLALALSVPAAYSMAFYLTARTRGLLLWILSTKMLPPVGVLMPVLLIFRTFDMLDTRVALIVMDTDDLTAGRMDVVHVLQRDSARYSRSRTHGWRTGQ